MLHFDEEEDEILFENESNKEDKDSEVSDFVTYDQHVLSADLLSKDQYIFYDKILRACKKAANSIVNGCIFPFSSTEGCLPKMDTWRVINSLREELMQAARTTPVIGYVFPSHEDTVIKNGDGSGPYCFGFNAMCGPNNLLVNLPVGTVFGLWRNPCHNKTSELNLEDLNGHEMVGSGYIVYGTRTTLVIAYGHGKGVYEYHLDQGLGMFVLKNKNQMKLPRKGTMYSVNEGYTIGWDDATKKMIIRMKDPRCSGPRTSFAIGSLVPDFHRILQFGGFYMYPATKLEPEGGEEPKEQDDSSEVQNEDGARYTLESGNDGSSVQEETESLNSGQRVKNDPTQSCSDKCNPFDTPSEVTSTTEEKPTASRKGSSSTVVTVQPIAWDSLSKSEKAALRKAGLRSSQLDVLIKNGLQVKQVLSLVKIGFVGNELISLTNLGLKYEQLKALASVNISTEDIITLYNEGVSVDQIVAICKSGVSAKDILVLIQKGYAASQILTLRQSGWSTSNIHSLVSTRLTPSAITSSSSSTKSSASSTATSSSSFSQSLFKHI